jgi:hypothetical protein
MYWGIEASCDRGRGIPVPHRRRSPVPAFDTPGAPLASWRVGAQSLLVEEELLLVDSLLDEEPPSDLEPPSDEDDDDEDDPFSPASLVSRARFLVP